MFEGVRKYLLHQFHHPNYLFFMVSLILLIIVPPFSSFFNSENLLLNPSFALVLLMGVFYTSIDFKQFIQLSILGIVLLAVFITSQHNHVYSYGLPIMMTIFFVLIFKNLINHIFRVEKIGINEIYASIAGYLVLGIIVAPFFALLEKVLPHSFNLPQNLDFYDFIYFSYITLTTVGYGDILPIHPIAKSFTILVGIFGQLYLTILVAIIIGKYIAFDKLKIIK